MGMPRVIISLQPGTFEMKRGRQVIVGNTRHANSRTAVRHRPSDEQGENFVKGGLLPDGKSVMLMDVVSHDGSPGGVEWALVHDMKGAKLGWIKTRNLHVQLI